MKFIGALSICFLILLSAGCAEDGLSDCAEPPSTRSEELYPGFTNTDDMDSVLTVGKKVEIPYAVANMKRALRSLVTASHRRAGDAAAAEPAAELTPEQIKPTHYHVRFSPRTPHQLDLLEEDTLAELFSYPLDRELTGAGTIPRAPQDESFGDLYAVWPAGKLFPAGVPHEILDTLFVPDDTETAKRLGCGESFADRLVDEAFRLTGNADEAAPGTTSTKWYPSGALKVWDDAVGDYIPLIGVKVRIHRSCRTYITYTDQWGEFRTRSPFRGKVRYSIIFEGKKYVVRDGKTGKADFVGPKKKGPWNMLIGPEGRFLRFATIHRAAFRHFVLDNCGFSRTRADHRIKIAYLNYYGSHCGLFKNRLNFLGVFNDILIWGAVDTENGKWRLTHQIFSTVSHELAHCCMYYRQKKSRYEANPDIITESWAYLMGWVIPDKEYEQLGYYGILHKYHYTRLPGYNYRFEEGDGFNHQNWNSHALDDEHYRKYTPLFIDLYDNSNQRYYFRFFNITDFDPMTLPNDDIELNDAAILENILDNSWNVEQIKLNVGKYKGRFGITDTTLDQFFKIYLENNL